MAPNLRRAASLAAASQAASQSQTVEGDVLPELQGLRNPKNLQELANLNLTDKNFHTWKHLMMAEFSYYGIDKIIDGSHLPSMSAKYHGYWTEIEHLFEHHLAINLSSNIYQMICQKTSLRDK